MNEFNESNYVLRRGKRYLLSFSVSRYMFTGHVETVSDPKDALRLTLTKAVALKSTMVEFGPFSFDLVKFSEVEK